MTLKESYRAFRRNKWKILATRNIRKMTIPDRKKKGKIVSRSIMPSKEILEKVLADNFADVTFSGGDPMFQPEGFTQLAHAIKERSRKNIWCYTGYTFEKLLRNPRQAQLLKYIDVLVDGKFKKELRDEELYFRGSRNQRLIDVQTSLQKGETVIYHYNPKKGI